MPRPRDNITIGTDPEFILIDEKNNLIRADSKDFFGSKSPTSKIGCDGAGAPVEIRPCPAEITNVEKMLNDITGIVSQIEKYCKPRGLHIEGGAKRYDIAIGGHIHFGGKELLLSSNDGMSFDSSHNLSFGSSSTHATANSVNHFRDFIKKPNIDKLVGCLDCYLTPIINFFIPQKEIIDRRQTGYGRLTEYRRQPWGIEYRTPYSFLFSPLLTNGVFALASLIAYNYKKFAPNKNLYGEVVQYYYTMNDNSNNKMLKKIYKKKKPRIKYMLTYNSPNPKLNGLILSIFNLIEQGKMVKDRNLFNNYKFGGKNLPFVLYYDNSRYIRSIRQYIEPFINNKGNGDLYLYQISSSSDRVGLTIGLPPLFEKECEIFRDIAIRDGIKYSIGISSEFLIKMMNDTNQKHIKTLIKYINDLRLPKVNNNAI